MAKAEYNLFTHTNYRAFLKEYYAAMKASTPYFSYRYFSGKAGFRSPNFLKLVMDGQRNLSGEATEKFIKALGFNASEARYFRILVLQNQAQIPEEKDYYTRQILKTKAYKKLKPLKETQYDYYSEWFHIPMRELVARSDFKNDPEWIARQFRPHLTEAQVKESLQKILELGLIAECPERGYKPTEHNISTGDDVTSLAVANYHRKMIAMGAESIDRFDWQDREIASLTLGVSKEQFEKIKERLRDFRKEILSMAEEGGQFDDVVQVNFQMFPVIKKEKGEE